MFSLLIMIGALMKKKTRVTFGDLPFDIVKIIFDVAGTCSSVCLGLTSTRNYAFLKLKYPDPIPLFQFICDGIYPDDDDSNHEGCTVHDIAYQGSFYPYNYFLCHLLEDWNAGLYDTKVLIKRNEINPDCWDCVEYLRPITIFGKASDANEAAQLLDAKYEDYNNVLLFSHGWCNRRIKGLKLPWPHNVGNAWEEECIEVIANAVFRFESRILWSTFFEAFDVYWRNRNKILKRKREILSDAAEAYKWEVWEDSRAMMGI
jgi:hypothetical protein